MEDTLVYSDVDLSIYNADCRYVLPSFVGESVDFVLTDPPYAVNYRGRWKSGQDDIAGDSSTDWIAPTFQEVWRVLRQDSFCLSFYGWPHADTFLAAWKQIGFRPVSHLVCVKSNIGLGHYSRSQHEPAYLLAKGRPSRPGVAVSDVFDWDRESDTVHPSQKPLGAVSRLINAFSREGDLVLDPFMGSGTTLLAARNMGRRAIGIDIEQKYCELARIRLAQQIFRFTDSSQIREEVL